MAKIGYGRQKLVQQIIWDNWEIEPDKKNFNYNELLFIISEMMDNEGIQYLQGGKKTGFTVFREFVKLLLYRNLANFDSLVLVSGFKGVGKSSVAIVIAVMWCKLMGKRFDPNRHIAYTNAQVVERLEILDKWEPLILDESINFMLSENWSLRQNKALKLKMGQVRTKHLLYIACFPLKIYKVDKTYLQSYCVTGDTKVLIKDSTGMIRNYPITELRFKKDYQVATYNNATGNIEYKKPKGCIKTSKSEEVFEIELENGQKIKATAEHEFLTKDGYKKLKKLNEKDELVIRTKKCLHCGKEFAKGKIMKLVKIKKITKLKDKEPVFDVIDVPDNHNFIANNIVVHNCNYWINIFSRGQSAIFVKDENPVLDAWRLKDFSTIGSYNEFSSAFDIEKKLRKHPNFWRLMKVPRCPEKLYRQYMEVREKNVYDLDDSILKSITKDDIEKALLIISLRDIMQNDTTLSVNRILLHIKNEYGVTLSKSQVQAAITEANMLVRKLQEKAIVYDTLKEDQPKGESDA